MKWNNNFQNVPLNKEGTSKKEGYTNPTKIDFIAESSINPTAWVMSRGSTIQLPAYKDCKVVMLPQSFLPMPMSLAFQKNSSLAFIINHQFAKLKETGVQDRILKKYTPLDPDCRHIYRALEL